MDPQERGRFDQDIERRIFCTHYSECLQFVAEIGWPNFTCEGPCVSYDPEHYGPEFWVEDALCCYALIHSARETV